MKGIVSQNTGSVHRYAVHTQAHERQAFPLVAPLKTSQVKHKLRQLLHHMTLSYKLSIFEVSSNIFSASATYSAGIKSVLNL